MRNRKEKWMERIIFIFMFLCTLPVVLFLLFILCNSFLSPSEFINRYGMMKHGNQNFQYVKFSFFPDKIFLEQYKEAFWDHSDFWYYFWNSTRISVFICIGTVIVSTLGAYAFAKLRFLGKRILLLGVIVFMMLPYHVMLSPQMMLLDQIGLLNHNSSVILPNLFTSFGVYLLYQFMVSIPKEYLEAAKLDGAGHITIFLKIVLPQVKDGIHTLIILNIIDTWNMVEQPLLFLKNQYQYPLSVVLSEGEELIEYNVFACCVVFLIPILLVFLICRNGLLNGIQNSVLK